jgi:hypothetical protein
MAKDNEIISRIGNAILKLEEVKDSTDVVGIGEICNDLSLASSYFSKIVADSYKLMNEAEDDYKLALAEKIKELTEDGTALSKGERLAEVELKEKKIFWTDTKNTYKRYDMYLDRIDRILDEFRQYCSSVKKIDFKHLNQGI